MLTTGQIERLAFPSRRRAQRRLRAYLDHGLVRAYLQGEALHRDSVWTLTALGLEFLEDRGERIEGARVYRPNARSRKLSHGLLVREVTVSLLLAERAGFFELRDLRHDSDLGSEPALAAAGIVPDGLALLRAGERTIPVLWETVSSEQPLGQARSKLLAYVRAVSGGSAFFRHPELAVLFIFENVSRLERFAALPEATHLGPRLHTLTVDEARDFRALAGRVMPEVNGFRPVR